MNVFYVIILLINRLFFGGYWPIRIISIRLIKESQNFQVIIGALYYLDMAISGMEMYVIKFNIKWIGIIKDLFDFIISEKEENILKYDNYIYSTFKCFVKQKTKLVFVPDALSFGNIDFRNLIMGQLVKTDANEEIERMKGMICDINDSNLPKKQVLTIFENVQQLDLDLYEEDGLYIISLLSLLSNIISHSSLKMVRIRLGYYKYNWKIRSLYSISKEMERKYENVGYNIHLNEKKIDGDVYIYCVIKIKS